MYVLKKYLYKYVIRLNEHSKDRLHTNITCLGLQIVFSLRSAPHCKAGNYEAFIVIPVTCFIGYLRFQPFRSCLNKLQANKTRR